jgi:hypothetical protein
VQVLRDLILSHAYLRPPFAIEVFTNKESRQVLEYFMDSYIRHFKLYKYVFTSRIVMDVALEFPNEPEEVPTPEPTPESEKEPIDEALAEAQMPDDELEEIIRYSTTHRQTYHLRVHPNASKNRCILMRSDWRFALEAI